MNFETLKNDEKIVLSLRSLYDGCGYRRYKMNKFEEYDLYARNKDFLISDQIITFTDTNGKLMALKPDVTLSIIKNTKEGKTSKVYYDENVYRVTGAHQGFTEIRQVGLECIGEIDTYRLYEVIRLAAESLRLISPHSVLDVSHLGIVDALLEQTDLSADKKNALICCLEEKNLHEMKAILGDDPIAPVMELLVTAYGAPQTVLPRLAALPYPKVQSAVKQLETITSLFTATEYEDMLRIDFSAAAADKYYNGIAFKGFVKGVPDVVLSGGQYSKLMRRMGRKDEAIGFAVYLDGLERMQGETKKYDIDTLLIYQPQDNVQEVIALAKQLSQAGSVSVVTSLPDDLKSRQIIRFGEKE